jgi:hypothetical protein
MGASYRADGAVPGPSRGLCGTCRHAQEIPTDRGAVFVRCGRSTVDPGYPRYPLLPVTTCRGHERTDGDTDWRPAVT